MPYNIQIARAAAKEAQEYAALIRDEHHSPEAAWRWLDGLYGAIKLLDENPSRFAAIPEAEELGFPYRSFIFHSHRVVYAVHDTEQLVIVHRIYHHARRSLRPRDLG